MAAGWSSPSSLRLHDYQSLAARNSRRPPGIPGTATRIGGRGGCSVPGGAGPAPGPGPARGRGTPVAVEPIWEPSPERVARANITRYLHWLRDRRGLRFASYDELWRWSVEDLDGFWTSIWEFFEVGGPAPGPALAERRMPGARWFPGATLNHAELSLRRHDDHPALLSGNEAGELGTIGYAELGRRVAAAAAGLRRLGVAKGDRVVAYLPNVPETVVAMLAVASIGAIWSSCAPEFGVSSVVDRFAQIEPRVLVAVDGYHYNGRWHDRRDALAEIRRRLPTLAATVLVGNGSPTANDTVTWDRLLEDGAGAELAFEPVAFDHPLWVLYSSGTT